MVVMLGVALLVIQAQDSQGGADTGKKKKKAGKSYRRCRRRKFRWRGRSAEKNT